MPFITTFLGRKHQAPSASILIVDPVKFTTLFPTPAFNQIHDTIRYTIDTVLSIEIVSFDDLVWFLFVMNLPFLSSFAMNFSFCFCILIYNCFDCTAIQCSLFLSFSLSVFLSLFCVVWSSYTIASMNGPNHFGRASFVSLFVILLFHLHSLCILSLHSIFKLINWRHNISIYRRY